MAVLVDPPGWPAHGRRWCHLVSDTSLAELHAFAVRLGLPARGFDADHYDLPAERHDDAVRAGALPVSGRELVLRLQASGLRRPKRHAERLLASTGIDAAGHRIDALAGDLPGRPAPIEVLLLVRSGGLLLLESGGLPRAPVPRIAAAPGETHADGETQRHEGTHADGDARVDGDLHAARVWLATWFTLEAVPSNDSQQDLGFSRLGHLRRVEARTGRPVSNVSVVSAPLETPARPATPIAATVNWQPAERIIAKLDPATAAFVRLPPP